MFSSQEGRSVCHLENGDNLVGLTDGDTGHLFLTFGEAGLCRQIANWPFGKMY